MGDIKAVYLCTDGTQFDTAESAEEHQKIVNIFDDVVKEYGRYGTIEINYLSDFLDIIQFVKDRGLELSKEKYDE